MSHTPKTRAIPLTLLVLACGASGSALAKDACGLLTDTEASRLLGVSAGKKEPQDAGTRTGSCVIRQADGGEDTLKVGIRTVSRTEASHLRDHMDDERGGDGGGSEEPWYEVSAPDPKHPNDRRLVIHRDRTTLTLELHSSHQSNAKHAFESVWHDIAERLPYDER